MNGVAHLAWERRGEGPPLVVLHGDVDHRITHPQFDRMAEFATVLWWDRRGFGATTVDGEPPTDPSDPRLDLGDLCAVVREHFDQPVHVLAYSGGGPLALAFALHHGENVASLILLSTYADEDHRVPLAQERVAHILGQRSTVSAPADGERDLERKLAEFEQLPHVHHHSAVPREIVRSWLREGVLTVDSTHPQAAHRTTFARVAALGDRLDEIDAPTLVLCGRHDAITPLECSERMAEQIPGAQLRVLEHSGHLAHAEEPDEFLRWVREFVISHR